MPRPHRNGQLLLVTTTDDRWRDYAGREGWDFFEIPRLESADLDNLAIPAELRPAVDGRPLIAQVLTAIEPGPGRPDELATADAGPALAWGLVLEALASDPAAVHLARVLAWCPPDPVPFAPTLERLAGSAATAQPLVDVRFVNLTQAAGASALQMHRLFGQAVRAQVWRDDPAAARQIVATLINDEAGQGMFISASDGGALRHLEKEDAGRAAERLAPDGAGLLWHGLGKIRDMRGPVTASGEYWKKGAELLNPGKHPLECAECQTGLARVAFQQAGSAAGAVLGQVTERTNAALQLLADLGDERAHQLSERAIALQLLSRRAAVERNPSRDVRRAELPQIIEDLWLSYERRVRIARELPETEPVKRQAPEADWGPDPDRAYFNLAGTYLALARAYDADSPELRENLERAGAIYTDCRRLREERYAGKPHPHLAACVYGEGLVAYYQAIQLSDQRRRLSDAIQHASAALTQRQVIASGLTGGDETAILRDVDVRKSSALVMKAAVAAILFAGKDPSAGAQAVGELVEEARDEMPDGF